MIKRKFKKAAKLGEPFEHSSLLEVKFLRNLIQEFLEVLFLPKYSIVSSVGYQGF